MVSVPSSEQLPLLAKLSHMGPRCQLLELPIYTGLTEIAALLDFGAIHNFISVGLVEELYLQLSVGLNLTTTIANTLAVLIGKYVTVPLKFRPSLQLISLQVLPNLSTPIVLVMQSLETVSPMVDWISKSIIWTDNGQ